MNNLARALSINGWMSEPELLYLAQIASKSNKIIEVGSYKGRSTRVLTDNTNGEVHAIDPWDGKYQVYSESGYHQNGNMEVYSQFYNNLNDHIKSGKLHVHMMNFHEYHDVLNRDDFDFIFIDAIHEYDALKRDINHALKLMKHGILSGHDYCPSWQPVVDVVDEMFPNHEVHGTIWSVEL